MKFLSMIDPGELDQLLARIGATVDASFTRHGFKEPHSASSVTHNIMALNTARDKTTAQREALITLVGRAKDASSLLRPLISAHDKNMIDLAIAAVEGEFKL